MPIYHNTLRPVTITGNLGDELLMGDSGPNRPTMKKPIADELPLMVTVSDGVGLHDAA